MKKSTLIFFSVLFPTFVHAQPQADWDGKACDQFVICSPEPPTQNDLGPCYESRSSSYSPNPIENDLIAICQAAKDAENASSDDRDDKLTRLTGLGYELTDEINDDPNDAEGNNQIPEVAKDFESLGSSVITYSSDQSSDDWNDACLSG